MGNWREWRESSLVQVFIVRKGGATLAGAGLVVIGEWAGWFGDGGPVIQLVIGLVVLALGAWILAVHFKNHS